MKVSAIIPAAGSGKRMGEIKKPYIVLCGRTMLSHTISVFLQCSLINELVIVSASGDENKCYCEIVENYDMDKACKVITGGLTRQESVFNGIKNLDTDTDIVIIHDCARPFLNENMIVKAVKAAEKWGAATIAVPVGNTIKKADKDGFVVETIDREMLWSIQTPQAFQYDLILKAHTHARENNIQVTDDTSLVEELGTHKVKLVMGASENMKITTPGDLVLARAIIESREENN
ncbi:2-C-methyl-D-erythritol 4-phosphate cytidylyltransferase [Candidatus Poribacteria bacterium]|nr:2-C-methyl-D-erythritol 4-phosphate cytidylyltransferase [Candidatus Poribacteria bacterium]